MIDESLIQEVERVYGRHRDAFFIGKSKDFKTLEGRRFLEYYFYLNLQNYSQVARAFGVTHATIIHNFKAVQDNDVIRLRCLNIRRLPTIEQQVHDLYNIIKSIYDISHSNWKKSQWKLYDTNLINKTTAAIMLKHYAQMSFTFVTQTLGTNAGSLEPLLLDKEIEVEFNNYYNGIDFSK